MAIEYLKSSKSEEAKAEEDAKTRAVVESTLADIEARGDAAVRDLSKKFDNYAPENFRLSDSEIEAAMSKVSARDMEDIKFAQTQIRKQLVRKFTLYGFIARFVASRHFKINFGG